MKNKKKKKKKKAKSSAGMVSEIHSGGELAQSSNNIKKVLGPSGASSCVAESPALNLQTSNPTDTGYILKITAGDKQFNNKAGNYHSSGRLTGEHIPSVDHLNKSIKEMDSIKATSTEAELGSEPTTPRGQDAKGKAKMDETWNGQEPWIVALEKLKRFNMEGLSFLDKVTSDDADNAESEPASTELDIKGKRQTVDAEEGDKKFMETLMLLKRLEMDGLTFPKDVEYREGKMFDTKEGKYALISDVFEQLDKINAGCLAFLTNSSHYERIESDCGSVAGSTRRENKRRETLGKGKTIETEDKATASPSGQYIHAETDPVVDRVMASCAKLKKLHEERLSFLDNATMDDEEEKEEDTLPRLSKEARSLFELYVDARFQALINVLDENEGELCCDGQMFIQAMGKISLAGAALVQTAKGKKLYHPYFLTFCILTTELQL